MYALLSNNVRTPRSPFHRPYLIILCVAVLILAVALGVTVVVTAALHLRGRRRCCWKGEYSVRSCTHIARWQFQATVLMPSTYCKKPSGLAKGGCRINCYTLIGDVKLQDVETKEVATVEFRSRRESKEEEEVIQV